MMVRASKHPFNVEESVVEAWTPGVWLDRPFPRPSRHTRLRQEWLNQPPLELKLALSPLVMAKQPHIAYFNIQADSLVGIINDIIGNRYTVGYGVSKPLAASKDVLLDIKMPRPSEQNSPRKSYLEYIAQLAGEFLDTIPEFESHNAAVYVKPSNPYTQSITRL
jgi:hypothetical protein